MEEKKPTGIWTDPVDSLHTETVYADWRLRLWATILDMLCLVVMWYLVYAILDLYHFETFTKLVYLAISRIVLFTAASFLVSFGLYTIIFWKLKGRTLGELVEGIRVVDHQTLGQPKLGSLVVRYFGYYLSAIPLGLGFLWIAWDKEKRGYHDKLAGTAVIDLGIKRSAWRYTRRAITLVFLIIFTAPIVIVVLGEMTIQYWW